MPKLRPHRLCGIAAAFLALVSAAGCGGVDRPSYSGAGMTGRFAREHVTGGQQPVTGSHIYLLAAGNAGLGSASSSLLVPGRSGVSTDGKGRGYVTSDAEGGFVLTASYNVCADPSAQVYLVAQGGNPGLAAGMSNAAIGMAASLGRCGSLDPAQILQVNELTTAAFASAFAPYATDAFHVGAPPNLGGGLSDAAAAAANLVNVTTGSANANVGSLVLPATALNTLSDALAACINSSTAVSVTCSALFRATGSAPDTLSAAFAVATQPASNVDAIFALASPRSPFQPTLSAAPADWTLAAQIPVPAVPSPGITELGDSISTILPGNGATPFSKGYGQLLADVAGAPLDRNEPSNLFSQGGDEGIDAAAKAWNQAAPLNAGAPPFSMMIGSNDVYFENPALADATYLQVYRETVQAAITLWLTPTANKLLPYGSAACSGAGWSEDGSFPAYARGLFTTTVGSPLTCTFSSAGGAIYMWHLVDTSSGTGTITVDGTLCATFSNTYPGYHGSHNGLYNTVAAVRCPAAAGSHTVTLTLTAGTHIGFEGLGSAPAAFAGADPAPRLYGFGPLHQAGDSDAAATLLYAKLFENLAAQLAGDGYGVDVRNVRDHVTYLGTPDPDSTGAAGTGCMSNALHPSNCGHAQIAALLRAALLGTH